MESKAAVLQQPDWELVLKRNSIERLKREKFPLDIRQELPALIQAGYEAVPEEDIVRLNWWGLTHDKPKVGTFMVRIKVPGGLVRPPQLRALGEIAARWGRNYAELTTRQGIQLHWVRLDQLPEVLEAVEAAGLTTAGGEGDTVRNITGCPVAGIDPEELFDVRGVIEEAARFFYGNPEYSNLPRKHKYTIAACPAQCNAPDIHDVALVGVVRDGHPGFAVRVGGGMSNTPRISRDLGVWVPAEEAVEVLRAITDVWQHNLRYRVSRVKARIKFMVDDYGPEGVRAMVEERLGRRLADGTAPEPTGEADHLGIHPQRQEGLVWVGVGVPVGMVAGTQLQRLADLLEPLGADVRFTRQQNVLLGNVPAEAVDEVKAGLEALGLPVEGGRPYARWVACTSHKFCNYSVAETKEKLREVVDGLRARFGDEVVSDLTVHMDGCPHACAQHWIGEIGLQGTTAPSPEGKGRIEAYDLTIRGGLGRRSAIGKPLLRRIPTHDLEGVLHRLVGAWVAERARRNGAGGGYAFRDFCDERSDDELRAIATGAAGAEAGAEPAGVVVRIPGTLASLTGGADHVEVQASTVRDALRAVGRQYPAFLEQVLPGDEVDAAFLVVVNDEDIRGLRGLDTPLRAGDEVGLVMAMSGG